jgi:hypothetical protein
MFASVNKKHFTACHHKLAIKGKSGIKKNCFQVPIFKVFFQLKSKLHFI